MNGMYCVVLAIDFLQGQFPLIEFLQFNHVFAIGVGHRCIIIIITVVVVVVVVLVKFVVILVNRIVKGVGREAGRDASIFTPRRVQIGISFPATATIQQKQKQQ